MLIPFLFGVTAQGKNCLPRTPPPLALKGNNSPGP